MATNQAKFDSLWKHVEDARIQWKFAHNHVNEINEDRAGMPSADGSYAYLRALHGQRLAVQEYLRALQAFKEALALEGGPIGPSEEEPAVETADGSSGQKAITRREREVLALIATGKSSKEIAAQLGMAFRTAVCHRYRLYRKLNVHTNVELTRVAMRTGLVEL